MKPKSSVPVKQLERDAPTWRKTTPRAEASRFLFPQTFPVPLTALIGRERELGALKRRFKKTRLLTLTGAGGSGKTRLALELAASLAAQFSDGLFWVELAPLADAALVPYTLAAALGVREKGGQSLDAALANFLKPRQLLLVLDNCEHLIDGCAHWSAQILQACPRVKILATSRERLGILGESVFPVPPLGVVAEGAQRESRAFLREVAHSSSAQLFVERASALELDFQLGRENATAIVEVCRRLDGLPLALELAAARIRGMSVHEIAQRLEDRFALLTMASRTAPARHQTLYAAMDWSYALLSVDERALFRNVAVFAGGWTMDAAEKLMADQPRVKRRTLDLLARLVDCSLVVKQEKNNATRYAMLETIRAYAWARAREADEADALRDKQLDYFCAWVETNTPRLIGREAARWTTEIESELDNLRAALEWSLHDENATARIEKGLRLAGALGVFWIRRGYFSEANRWLTRLLAVGARCAPAARVQPLEAAAAIAIECGEMARGVELAQACWDAAKELDDARMMGWALCHLGMAAHHRGERAQAVKWLQEAVDLLRAVKDAWGSVLASLWLADTRMRLGELDAAKPLWEGALAQARAIGETWGQGWALGGLGDVARLQGDFVQARAYFTEALALHYELGNTSALPYTLEALANLAAMTREPKRAAELWGAGEALRQINNEPLPPSYRNDYAPHVASARKALGEQKFHAAWVRGGALSLAQVVALALGKGEPAASAPASFENAPLEMLTVRELEILQLLAAGLSNQQIARQLSMTVGTVKWHAHQIYSKLDAPNRTRAVARARELNFL
ncbi:MAG: tetratricopeptide repeat protein [Chloroflexi bacterium]|nr:tetratricopeptide repeat protein [Chloroflexota bacterium]